MTPDKRAVELYWPEKLTHCLPIDGSPCVSCSSWAGGGCCDPANTQIKDYFPISAPVAQPDVGEDPLYSVRLAHYWLGGGFPKQALDILRNVLSAAGEKPETEAVKYNDGQVSTLPSPPAADAELVKLCDEALLEGKRWPLAAPTREEIIAAALRTRLLATPERGTDAGEQAACKPVDIGAIEKWFMQTTFPQHWTKSTATTLAARFVHEVPGMIAGPVVTREQLRTAFDRAYNEYEAKRDIGPVRRLREYVADAILAIIEGRAP